MPLLGAELLRSLPPEAASRAAYERAVLRYRQGTLDGIAAIDPALLPDALRMPAQFLRLEAGIDEPDGWLSLARVWPAPAVVLRAAQRLFDTQRHAELAQLAPLPGTTAMHRHLLFVHALSLHALGRDDDMLEPLFAALALPGPEQGVEPLRALAVAALAKQPFDAKKLARAGLPEASALDQLARQAMASGNFATARAAAEKLVAELDPRWRGQGLALAGEVDWRKGDVESTSAAFARIFEPAQKLGVYRDPAALQLAHALVVVQAERRDAAVGRRLANQLAALVAQVHLKAVPQAEALLTATREAAVDRGEQPVALGEVSVGVLPAPPPAPRLDLDLPEPVSLLAIPAPDGSLRAWFDRGGAL